MEYLEGGLFYYGRKLNWSENGFVDFFYRDKPVYVCSRRIKVDFLELAVIGLIETKVIPESELMYYVDIYATRVYDYIRIFMFADDVHDLENKR